MRRNNTPASSEIAVLLPGDGMEASNRDIVLHKKGGGIIRINEFETKKPKPKNSINRVENIENSIQQVNIIRNNIEIENIQVDEYLVDDAESVNINKDKSKITTMDHYAYRLMIRKNTQQWLHRSGRLAQQYACDMYSKIIGESLNYIKFHQNDFRMTLKSG
jgi:hypothetical protein